VGEQFMQEGRPASGHSRDEYWTLDGLAFGIGAFCPDFLKKQSRFEKATKMNPRQEASERMQISLPFDALEENGEAEFDCRVAEALQPGPALRLGAQRVTVQRAKPAAGSVTKPEPQAGCRLERLEFLVWWLYGMFCFHRIPCAESPGTRQASAPNSNPCELLGEAIVPRQQARFYPYGFST
jgi:hypothetical protein